ncbi:ABC transporter permease [Microbacterium sp. MPKO10]|uniref:ABC transporter permease n=1 Tax=Microbacterium sp. MPKO10 TaxID=2989818 RepID=UPI002235EDEF|nr:ABC transporter permease [Microbacterium sp. MPKO10]MCW4459850.1 ABC transporter permease [Microbacterium sp. MPKO10]
MFSRLGGLIVVLFIVSIVVFLLLYISGGDAALALLGNTATPEQVAAMRSSLGLDRPLMVQYGDWILGVFHGDLGQSFYRRESVVEVIFSRLEPTVSIAIVAQLVALCIAVPLGIASARRVNSTLDGIVTTYTMIGMATPGFVFALLLALVFAFQLQWFPLSGYSPLADGVGTWLRFIALPAISLGVVHSALLTRMTRSSMLDVLSQDFIRTARSKGASSLRIVYGHALKNAAIPIVTLVGVGFAVLVTGALVTETIFNVPGLGKLMVESIERRDIPVIQGVVLLATVTFIFINFVVDVLYLILDPRVRQSA